MLNEKELAVILQNSIRGKSSLSREALQPEIVNYQNGINSFNVSKYVQAYADGVCLMLRSAIISGTALGVAMTPGVGKGVGLLHTQVCDYNILLNKIKSIFKASKPAFLEIECREVGLHFNSFMKINFEKIEGIGTAVMGTPPVPGTFTALEVSNGKVTMIDGNIIAAKIKTQIKCGLLVFPFHVALCDYVKEKAEGKYMAGLISGPHLPTGTWTASGTGGTFI